MNKYQKWLVVSLVFLATAFVMPIYVLSTASTSILQQLETEAPNWESYSPETGGVSTFLQTQQTAQTQLLTIVIVVEAMLVAAFSLTLWYAIKCRDLCRSFPAP